MNVTFQWLSKLHSLLTYRQHSCNRHIFLTRERVFSPTTVSIKGGRGRENVHLLPKAIGESLLLFALGQQRSTSAARRCYEASDSMDAASSNGRLRWWQKGWFMHLTLQVAAQLSSKRLPWAPHNPFVDRLPPSLYVLLPLIQQVRNEMGCPATERCIILCRVSATLSVCCES